MGGQFACGRNRKGGGGRSLLIWSVLLARGGAKIGGEGGSWMRGRVTSFPWTGGGENPYRAPRSTYFYEVNHSEGIRRKESVKKVQRERGNDILN